MITLKESVNIPAPFEKLDAWVDNFEDGENESINMSSKSALEVDAYAIAD